MRAREILSEIGMPLGKPVKSNDLTFGFEVELFMTPEFVLSNDDNADFTNIKDIKSYDEFEKFFETDGYQFESSVEEWGEENGIEDGVAEAMFDDVGALKFAELTRCDLHYGIIDIDGNLYQQPSYYEGAYALSLVIEDHIGLDNIELPDSYEQKTDNKDYHSRWYLEPDASLRPNNEADYGIELTSPILKHQVFRSKLTETLELIARIDGLYTNGTSGLHINIGFANGVPPIDRVKLLAFAGEEWLGKLFARANNDENVASLFAKMTTEVEFDRSFDTLVAGLNTFLDGLDDKSFAINLLPLNEHGYIEFRTIGGAGYESRTEEVFHHVDRFIRLIEVATNPQAGRRDYMKKLYAAMAGGTRGPDTQNTETRMIREWLAQFGPRTVERYMGSGTLNWTAENLFMHLWEALMRGYKLPPVVVRALLRSTKITAGDRDEIAAQYERQTRYRSDEEMKAFNTAMELMPKNA